MARLVLNGQPRVGVPGTRVRVQLGPLERTLMAWAFWNLERLDLLTLTRPQAPEKHQKQHLLHVYRGQGDHAVSGLEAELLDCWTNEGDDVALIIERWAGRGRPLPLDAVVAVARDEAADFGLWDKDDSVVATAGREHVCAGRPAPTACNWTYLDPPFRPRWQAGKPSRKTSRWSPRSW